MKTIAIIVTAQLLFGCSADSTEWCIRSQMKQLKEYGASITPDLYDKVSKTCKEIYLGKDK